MFDFSDKGWVEFQDHVRSQARELGTPAFGTFELTPLCNFACKMCYVRLDPKRMRELGRLRTVDEWIDMARQALDAGTVGITLTGGEVLTRPDFAEIYEGIVDQGGLVSVLSNGSLVDGSIVRLFSTRPPAHLRFTLYGASNETYELLCGVDNGFDRVMSGLRMLQDAGIRFSLAFTETSINIQDFDGVCAIAQDFDVPIVFGTGLVPGVRGAVNSVDNLRVEKPKVLRPNVSFGTNRTGGDREDRLPAMHPFARCRSYRNSFWIDWNGDMEMCSFMSSCKAKPFEDGFALAWRQLLEYLDGIRSPSECADCNHRYLCAACPGVLEAETGSPECVCDRMCSAARTLAQEVGRLKKGVEEHEKGIHGSYHENLCD